MPDITTIASAWSTDDRARHAPRVCDDTIEITDDMLMDLDRDLDLPAAPAGARRPPPWDRLPRP
jgi:hypothetical protein